MRDDLAIILGQFLSYYICIWNLNIKGIYGKIPIIIRIVLLLTPIAVLISIAGNAEKFISAFFQNEAVPTGLLLFGVAGQILFSLRFLYQWIYSLRNHESSLPAGFWIMSLSGSAIIVCYGIARLDPVLILGQSVEFAAYVRNLILCKRETAR